MSWASIVTHVQSSTKQTRPLKVQYSYVPKTGKIADDRIPRDKEITPDPADDFTMMSSEAYDKFILKQSITEQKEVINHIHVAQYLTAQKAQSSQCLQCLTNWMNNIESTNPKIIDLNFEEMKQEINENIVGHERMQKLFYISHHWNQESNPQLLKLWCGYESIIHYILSNDNFFLPVSNPDVANKHSKINKLISSNILLPCMKQCISILQLLLIDTSLVRLQDGYKSYGSWNVSVYQQLKYILCEICENEEYYAQYNAISVLELFVSLYLQCDTASDCLVGINYNNSSKRWQYMNFLGAQNNDSYGKVQKMSANLVKKLLFRSYNAFILKIYELKDGYYDTYDIHTYEDLNTILSNKNITQLFTDACKTIMNPNMDVVVHVESKYGYLGGDFDQDISDLASKVALTTPLMILPFLKEAKNEMRNLLTSYVPITGDCITIILVYLYPDLHLLYNITGFQNLISVKSYELLNCLEQIDSNALNKNDRFRFDAVEISNYLFKHHENVIIKRYFDSCMAADSFLKPVCCMISMYEKPISQVTLRSIIKKTLWYKKYFDKSHLEMLCLKYHAESKDNCNKITNQVWTELQNYWESDNADRWRKDAELVEKILNMITSCGTTDVALLLTSKKHYVLV